MPYIQRPALTASLAALLTLTACGGGGGGSSAPAAAAAAPQPLATVTAPAASDLSTTRSRTVRLADVASPTFLASAQTRGISDGRLYVSLWYLDTSGDRQQLAFLTVAVMRALDSSGGVQVQSPVGTPRLYAEVYGQDPQTRALVSTGVQELGA